MKTQILKTSLVLLLLIISSCSNDDNANDEQDISIELIANTWEVVKIKTEEDNIYLFPDKGYTILFENDGTFNLNISPNHCIGDYEVLENESITIAQMLCTEAAGQTEFTTNLSNLILKMATYYEKNGELIFEGQGEIILKPL